MSWEDFLHRMAIAYGLSPEQAELFILRLNDDYKNLKENQFHEIARQELTLDKPAYDKRKQGIFSKFNQSQVNPDGCPHLDSKGPGKLEILRQWLEEKYSEQLIVSHNAICLPSTPEIDWDRICFQMLKSRQFNFSKTRGNPNPQKEIYVPAKLARFGHEFNATGTAAVDSCYDRDQFFEQIINNKTSNFAILGQPGTGKSTWLWQLAQYATNSGKSCPIYISLSSIKGMSLQNYLLHNWLEDTLSFIPNAQEITPVLIDRFQDFFKSGKVWLLLDDVEQMSSENQSPLSALSCQLTGWIAEARIILSCRLSVWESRPNVFPRFETYCTIPFDDEQIEEFIEQWFSDSSPEIGKQLKEKLSQPRHEQIRDLCTNPSRLAMLCRSWSLKKGELPAKKALLYRQFKNSFCYWKFLLLET